MPRVAGTACSIYFSGVLLAFALHDRATAGAPQLLYGYASRFAAVALLVIFIGFDSQHVRVHHGQLPRARALRVGPHNTKG